MEYLVDIIRFHGFLGVAAVDGVAGFVEVTHFVEEREVGDWWAVEVVFDAFVGEFGADVEVDDAAHFFEDFGVLGHDDCATAAGDYGSAGAVGDALAGGVFDLAKAGPAFGGNYFGDALAGKFNDFFVEIDELSVYFCGEGAADCGLAATAQADEDDIAEISHV